MKSTSAAVGALVYALCGYPSRAGTAVSAEAEFLRKTAFDLGRSAEQSQALFGEKQALLSELACLAEDCGKDDWDGNDGQALDPDALQNAEDFVRALPDGVRLPECAPEPDGSVSLDWISSRRRLFSLSVGKSNRLAYAWLDGSDEGHGVASFDGARVPERVLAGIWSLL
jgi:hypothetical protein